jgi:hypothetical protein
MSTTFLSYADRCHEIAWALRDLTWTTKQEEIYEILDALDSFRKGGSAVSTVRAVLSALRRTNDSNDFDRVCSWCSEWLAYHVNQPRPALEPEFITDAREKEELQAYANGGPL